MELTHGVNSILSDNIVFNLVVLEVKLIRFYVGMRE